MPRASTLGGGILGAGLAGLGPIDDPDPPMTHNASAWGKLDRSVADRTQAPRLTLVAHCIDVAAVTRALLDLPTWRRRLLCLAQRPRFTATDLDRLTVLAFLHDAGKAGAGFYSKALSKEKRSEWRRRASAPDGAFGHTRVVAALLDVHDAAIQPHRFALGLDAIERWGGADRVEDQVPMLDLWLACVSHHGDPLCHDELAATSQPGAATWLHPIDDYSPLNGLLALGTAARALWPRAFDDETPFGRPTPALTHAIAGVVSLADWIGSNAAESHFPYGLGGQQGIERWPIAIDRARQVLQRLRIDVEAARASLLISR